MIELLGTFPRRLLERGRLTEEYFNRHRELRHIKRLRSRRLEEILARKLSPQDAKEVADFLRPMLRLDPKERSTAQESLRHPWLQEDANGYGHAPRPVSRSSLSDY